MAACLILGAIPSGLAGTANSVSGLYAVRFFIGEMAPSLIPNLLLTSRRGLGRYCRPLPGE
jgi:NNP family nitrate/nitrite transporter-like MFS transporter